MITAATSTDLTMLRSERLELERSLLNQGLDLLRAIQSGEMLPAEAAKTLFKTDIICELGDRGISADVISFFEKGFFLEDVEEFIGAQQLERTIAEMETLALRLLAKRSPKGYCPWMLAKKESFARKVAAISFVLPRATTAS